MSLSDLGSWASVLGLVLTGITLWIATRIRAQVQKALLSRSLDTIKRQTDLAIKAARRLELDTLREHVRDLADNWDELIELAKRQRIDRAIGSLYTKLNPKRQNVRQLLVQLSILESPKSLVSQTVIRNLESTYAVISEVSSILKEHGK